MDDKLIERAKIYARYTIRVCIKKERRCVFCGERILKRERYHDGAMRRAHESCVKEILTR